MPDKRRDVSSPDRMPDGKAWLRARGAWAAPLSAAAMSIAINLIFGAHARGLAALRQLGLDALFYHEWALDILAGRGYDGAYFQGPLFPYFLAAVYRLSGPGTAAAQGAQLVLAALCTAMVFVMARRLAGPRGGWAAAVLHAAYGYGLVLSRTLVPAILLETLLLAAVLAGWAGASAVGRRRAWSWWIAAGVLLGSAALGRPSVLLIPLPLLAARVLGEGRRRPSSLLPAVVTALAVVLVLVPVALRNARLDGGFVPVSANGGYNYYVGNHDGATDTFEDVPGVAFFQPGTAHDGGTIALAQERSLNEGTTGGDGAAFSASQASAWWWRQGLRWNRENPGRTAALWGRKLAILLSDYEVPQIENYQQLREDSVWLRRSPFRFAALMGLGVVGMALTIRRRDAAALAWLAAGVLLSVLPFFVVARFRLPLVPLLAVFGGAAVAACADRFARRQRVSAWIPAAAAVAVAALTLIHVPAGLKAGADLLREYNRGVLAVQENDVEGAIGWFRTSVRLHPEHGPSWSNLGASLRAAGRAAEAIPVLARALRLEPDNRQVLIQFVGAALESDRAGDATAELETHVRDHPESALAWLLLGDLRRDAGDDQGAVFAWRQALTTARDPEVARVANEKLASVR